jgi:hypothetical protein
VQAKERRNVELKRIIPHNLGDSVWPIMEWLKLPMGSYKVFFLQVQPKFFAHLKLMWNLMLIMAMFGLVVITEISSAHGDKKSTSSKQD